jgi:hypothetical protein
LEEMVGKGRKDAKGRKGRKDEITEVNERSQGRKEGRTEVLLPLIIF